MENVVCSCNRCKAELGCFRNAWNGIGNTYFSPAYPTASSIDGFVVMKSIYKGTDQTQIANSYLQDVACKGCGVVLGLRCDNAPEGHLLKRNQLILRLAEITVTSEWTGEKTAVSILERFPLTLPGAKKPTGVRRASTVQPSHRAGTPGLMNRPNAANSMFASPIDDMQVRQLEKFTDWARTAIKSQQNDMNQIGAAIDRMERDMKSFRDFMQEIRTELTTYHQFQESMKEKELPVLREDLKGLRIEVDANRQFRNTLTEEEFPVLQEDIDALRSELAKTQQFQQQLKHHDLRILGQNLQGLRLSLGELTDQKEDKLKLCHDEFDTLMDEVRELNRKANEIDGVRAELEYFKARIASLESSQETLMLKKAENPRVELASEPKSGTIPGREDKVPLAESLQPSKHIQQSRYEWSEKRDQSLPKRWNFHSENNDEVSYEPPTKRLRRSAGRVSTRYLSVPFQTPESPIVVSSNHGTPSPILDRHGLRNEGGELSGLSGSCVQFKDQEDNIHSVPQLTDSPPQTNQKHLGKRQPLSRSTMPPVLKYPNSGLSQEALERPCGISASSISAVTAYRRRASNSSLQNNLISDPLDEKLSGDNITVSSSSGRLDGRRFRRKARYSNVTNDNLIMDFRPQDCSGALLNSAETSGERSYQLRRRVSSKGIDKPKYARQRSETPDQLSIIIADGAMQKSVPRRASDGAKVRGSNLFGRSVRAPKGNIDFDSPLPSVEGNTEPAVADFSIVIPCAMSPPPAKSFDAKNDRPFACIGCGKTYKFVGNLERHKVMSIRCRDGEGTVDRTGNAEEDDTKRQRVRERERLATEILENQ